LETKKEDDNIEASDSTKSESEGSEATRTESEGSEGCEGSRVCGYIIE
jgi:hypothetical protein